MNATCKLIFLVSCVCLASSCHGQSAPNQETTTALQRGIDYLLDQQSEDGLWHSPNYGNLKDGAAMTAFVLYSLGNHPLDDKAKLQNAVDKLVPMVREKGYVTNPDGPDYTNYGSAMLLAASEQLELSLPDDVKRNLQVYLVRSQLDDEEGFAPGDVDYGGWDLSGWMTGKRPTTGTNISVSSSVIEVLADVPGPTKFDERDKPLDDVGVDGALMRAAIWLRGVQNRDGGFFFHPKADHDGNKAGWSDNDERKKNRSYGSATADGLRMLVDLGKTKDDKAVQAAVAWLSKHPDLKTVPGFSHEQGEGSWAYGLRYYYYQSLSRSLSLFPENEAKRIANTMMEILTAEQTEDGSWTNPNARMREDDPLIATGFAVTALRNCDVFLNRQ